MKVLVVEDDPTIAEPLVEGLARHGLEPTSVRTGRAALDEVGDADLVLLDLGLPDLDGMEVCRQIRARHDIPIIVVSARGDEIDRVMLLELGADDYVVKPFGLRELVARVRAVTRRTSSTEPLRPLEVGPLRVDLRVHEVTVDGRVVELTPKEFDLLAFLASDPGATFSRRDIIESVWDRNWYGSAKTLDVHMASLRRKIGHPEWLPAVRGVGFRLDVPADAAARTPDPGDEASSE